MRRLHMGCSLFSLFLFLFISFHSLWTAVDGHEVYVYAGGNAFWVTRLLHPLQLSQVSFVDAHAPFSLCPHEREPACNGPASSGGGGGRWAMFFHPGR